MSNKSGRTRQGVRDLSSLPSKPRGIRLEMPPPDALGAGMEPETAREHAREVSDNAGKWRRGQK